MSALDLAALFARHWPDDPPPRLTELGLVADADDCGGRSRAFVSAVELRRGDAFPR